MVWLRLLNTCLETVHVWEGGAERGFEGWGQGNTHTLFVIIIIYYFVIVSQSAVSAAALFDLVHLFLQVHLSLNVLYHHL